MQALSQLSYTPQNISPKCRSDLKDFAATVELLIIARKSGAFEIDESGQSQAGEHIFTRHQFKNRVE